MKKVLKNSLIAFLALIATYFVICFTAPAKLSFVEEKVIDAPLEKVFPQVADFALSGLWNPWQAQDSTLQYVTSTPSTGLGATQSWKGQKMGEGTQTITEFELNKKVTTELFFKQWNSKSLASYNLTEVSPTSTKVSWSYADATDAPIYLRGVFKLMGMEKHLRADYQKGLQSLNAICIK